MYGHFALSMLLSLACVAATYAAGPQDDPAPVPPDMNLDGPALIQDEAWTTSSSACPEQSACVRPRYAAYRGQAMRHQFGDSNCCAEQFGGFGPLWETYCADKNRCCGAATACGPSTRYPRFEDCGCRARCAPPLLSGYYWQALRARFQRSDCCTFPSCDCDCTTPTMFESDEAALQQAVPPAEPSPAMPDEADQLVPAPPPGPPEPTPATSTSSRRSWMQKRVDALPR